MEQYEKEIQEVVKKELEHMDTNYHVCQWVLAMAVREEPPDCWLDEKQTFLARIVTKTDECIPVDGLDVLFVVESDGTISAPDFFENSPSETIPIFTSGSTVQTSLW